MGYNRGFGAALGHFVLAKMAPSKSTASSQQTEVEEWLVGDDVKPLVVVAPVAAGKFAKLWTDMGFEVGVASKSASAHERMPRGPVGCRHRGTTNTSFWDTLYLKKRAPSAPELSWAEPRIIWTRASPSTSACASNAPVKV